MANEKENVNPASQTEDLPEPQISEPQAGQSFAQAGDPTGDLESLRAMVREELQSVKDTRIGKSETRLDVLENTIAKYEAEKGGTVDKTALSKLQGVAREEEILTRLKALEGGKAPETSAGAGTQGWKERRASILSDAGIEGNDPRFISFMKQKFSSYDDMNTKLFKEAEGWSFTDETKPKPSASTVAQVVPSVPTGDGDYTTEKYVEDMISARGNKGKLDAIRAKAKADGLEIDRISINM